MSYEAKAQVIASVTTPNQWGSIEQRIAFFVVNGEVMRAVESVRELETRFSAKQLEATFKGYC